MKLRKLLCLFLVLILIIPGGMPLSAAEPGDLSTSEERFEQTLNEARQILYNNAAYQTELELILIENSLPHRPPVIDEPDPAPAEESVRHYSTTSYSVGSTRMFAGVGQGKLIGQGTHTNIWVLSSNNNISTTLANSVAAEFDATYLRMTGSGGFGAHNNVTISPGYGNMTVIGDVDGDGRVNYVFYDMSWGGFFQNSDFWTAGSGNNELDMVHINLKYLNDIRIDDNENNRLNMYNVMAHELQHLLFYMYFNVYAPSGTSSRYTWFNESLSELAGTFFIKNGAEVTSIGRLFDAAQNSYASGNTYGDLLNFNNSLKSYGMGYLFSMLMHKSSPGGSYSAGIYGKMQAEYPPAQNNAGVVANQNKISNAGGHDAAVGMLLQAATGIGSGADTLALVYTLFMESFAADGGTIHDITPKTTTKFHTATNAPSNLWGFRPVAGVSGGIVYAAGDGSGYNVQGYAAYPTLPLSGGTITLQGFGSPQPSGEASHERLFKLSGGSVGTPIITITAPNDGNSGTRYYLVIPNDAANAPNSFTTGTGGADVYPLTKGVTSAINTGGRPAYLFVTTLYQNVHSTLSAYSWRGASDAESVEGDRDALTWDVIRNRNTTQATVRTNLTLLTLGALGSSIEWNSTDTNVIANNGTVSRPSGNDKDVTLTAIISKGSATPAPVTFNLTVMKEVTDSEAVELDMELLTWDRIRNANISEQRVTSNLILPAQGEESAISWSSSNTAVIDINGRVTRPAVGESDAEVRLTATVSRGGVSDTVLFNLTVTAMLGGFLVPSNNSNLTIDLSAETINLRGFKVAAYSLDGGNKWKKGPLPTDTKFAGLFNKGMELWLSDTWNDKNVKENKVLVVKKGVPDDANIVTFPKINKRPKAEKLVAHYPITSMNTWYLAKKGDTETVTAGYEFANTTNRKTPDNKGWQPLGAFSIQSGKDKATILVRSAPVAAEDNYTPASKIFSIRAANYGKAPSIKVNDKKAVVSIKAKHSYATAIDGAYTDATAKTVLPLDSLGMPGSKVTLYIIKTPTGKKPRSEIQELRITIPTPTEDPADADMLNLREASK